MLYSLLNGGWREPRATLGTAGPGFAPEHEEHIAEIERRAAEAAERGDEWNHRRNLEYAEQLRAMRYPSEDRSAGSLGDAFWFPVRTVQERAFGLAQVRCRA